MGSVVFASILGNNLFGHKLLTTYIFKGYYGLIAAARMCSCVNCCTSPKVRLDFYMLLVLWCNGIVELNESPFLHRTPCFNNTRHRYTPGGSGLRVHDSMCVSVSVSVCRCVHVCTCVRVWVWVWVWVCVDVCMWVHVSVCMCVCVCVWLEKSPMCPPRLCSLPPLTHILNFTVYSKPGLSFPHSVLWFSVGTQCEVQRVSYAGGLSVVAWYAPASL